jgi:hypothetical protein
MYLPFPKVKRHSSVQPEIVRRESKDLAGERYPPRKNLLSPVQDKSSLEKFQSKEADKKGFFQNTLEKFQIFHQNLADCLFQNHFYKDFSLFGPEFAPFRVVKGKKSLEPPLITTSCRNRMTRR